MDELNFKCNLNLISLSSYLLSLVKPFPTLCTKIFIDHGKFLLPELYATINFPSKCIIGTVLSPCNPWNTSCWVFAGSNLFIQDPKHGNYFISLNSMEYILFIQDPKHWNYFISLHSVDLILFSQDPKHGNYFISLHSVEYILFIQDPKHENYFISLCSVEYILFIQDPKHWNYFISLCSVE